jgi:hypothetical protein
VGKLHRHAVFGGIAGDQRVVGAPFGGIGRLVGRKRVEIRRRRLAHALRYAGRAGAPAALSRRDAAGEQQRER